MATHGLLGNPGREARAIERELARHLGLLGIRVDDGAAIRQLLARAGSGRESGRQESPSADLLGLALVLAKLLRQSAATGDKLALEPATRAFVDAMLGAPAATLREVG